MSPRDVPGWDQAMAKIGPDERLAADFDLLAPLAQRDGAYLYPCPYEDDPRERVCTRSVSAPPTIDVVLTRDRNRASLEQRGFKVQAIPNSDLVIGRP